MITRNEIEALIDKLADNNLNTRSHPIYLGDVLERIDGLNLKSPDLEHIFPEALSKSQKKKGVQLHYNNLDLKLCQLWRKCGFNKSLQQIFDDSGWEEGYIQDGKFFPSECTVEIERLKDPSAQSLGEYLLTIFKV